MRLDEFMDSKLESEVLDVIILDSKGKIVESEIKYDAKVKNVTYKKIAIIETDQQ